MTTQISHVIFSPMEQIEEVTLKTFKTVLDQLPKWELDKCSSNSHSVIYRSPITTGTSVIGIQFKDGVLIAADVLGSYGSLARYRNLERLMKVNDNIILGASGDYADFQCIKSYVEKKM